MSKDLDTLDNQISTFTNDPLGFVLHAFPWGHGELKNYPKGPDAWQREALEEIGLCLSDSNRESVIRQAVASGHGVGKSALVAWIILWAMATGEDTRGVVTANTEVQLKTKTWSELAKWHRLCICKSWFECTATALISTRPGHNRTWRIDMVAWSERNTEAFAGLHNQGRRVLLIFDEASAIPDLIWEVSEGALTDADTQIMWCCFGNPTRSQGRFRECFGKYAHRWSVKRVDSRTAALTNKELLKSWVDDYGEDSDFVRVRVRGEFPRSGTAQFIGSDAVHSARGRQYQDSVYALAPKTMAVDVARFGADQSVITKRQGLVCFPQLKYRGLDLMTLSGIVVEEYQAFKPDALFVDGVGLGAGVVDRLRQLGVPVIDAQAGATALHKDKFRNRRAEMWAKMKDWIGQGAIPDDPALAEDLSNLEYSFTDSGALQLERKEDLKSRGLSSPDCADSLALTFYAPVTKNSGHNVKAKTDYNIMEWK